MKRCPHTKIIRYRERRRRIWDRCRQCGARREYQYVPPPPFRQYIRGMQRADGSYEMLDVTMMSGQDVPLPWKRKE